MGSHNEQLPLPFSTMTHPVVALDIGGATLKATRVTPSKTPSHKQGKHALASASSAADYASAGVVTLANQIATVGASGQGMTLLGKELLDKERQRAKLHYLRPVERGYCVNWNIESELMAHLFSSKMLSVTPAEHTLVTTAPLFAPTVLNETMDEVVFEEFGFAAYSRVPSAEMCVLSHAEHCRQQAAKAQQPQMKRARAKGVSTEAVTTSTELEREAVDEDEDWRAFHKSSCQLVVDSGFSFTHVTPVIDGRVYSAGVKRINVGGKLLTNYLKEIVSYRQWNVMDESVVINELKEALCYCSLDFEKDLRRYHRDRASRKHWILPDFVRSFSGRLRPEATTTKGDDDDDEQALEMGVEMITVPEVLFHPSGIGIDQAGLAEAIMQSVDACPIEVRSTLLANILLVGGNSKFRHFRERLEHELRPLVPEEYEIQIVQPDDPISSAVDGCVQFAKSDLLKPRLVTKQEYDEHGSNICLQRFR